MKESELAQKLADLINEIEAAGLALHLSPNLVRVGEASVVVGWGEDDPWTVES